MDSFKELMIDICKIQSANARAHVKHVDFQNSLQENPIYPEDRHDSDEEELKIESINLRRDSDE